MNPKVPPALPTHRAPVIRVVAPSGTLIGHEDNVKAGIRQLKGSGFTVQIDNSLMTRSFRGYLSGSDEERGAELLDAIGDDAVDIVWWARGGSGGARLLTKLLPSLEMMPPKWLIGFSDATSILNAISLSLKWVTLHGPTVSLLSSQSKKPGKVRQLINNINYLNKNKGLPVYGGNVTVMASAMGLLDLDSLDEHHLLLEDVNEHPYRLDRTLTQLRQCWPLDKIKSIWLGDLDLNDEQTSLVTRLIEEDFGCPVYTNAPAGHRGLIEYIPLGLPIFSQEPNAAMRLLNQ